MLLLLLLLLLQDTKTPCRRGRVVVLSSFSCLFLLATRSHGVNAFVPTPQLALERLNGGIPCKSCIVLHHSSSSSNNPADPSTKESFLVSPPPKTVTGVTLKIAVDSQGGAVDLAGKPERFTCPTSLDMVHRLRACSQAVLVGRSTVKADNPSLTVRRPVVDMTGKKQPLRVVLDPNLKLLQQEVAAATAAAEDSQYALFHDGFPTVVYYDERITTTTKSLLQENLPEQVSIVGLPRIPGDGSGLDVKRLVQSLQADFGVHHLMVEGGPATAKAFLEAQLVDRVLLVRAPVTFREPLLAGLDDLVQFGLDCLGRQPSGVDEIVYWSRPGLAWPTDTLTDWP